jgi:hypothetical protein
VVGCAVVGCTVGGCGAAGRCGAVGACGIAGGWTVDGGATTLSCGSVLVSCAAAEKATSTAQAATQSPAPRILTRSLAHRGWLASEIMGILLDANIGRSRIEAARQRAYDPPVPRQIAARTWRN